MFGKRSFVETETVTGGHHIDTTSKRRRCAWEEATRQAPELAAQTADQLVRQLLASMLPTSGCSLQGRTNTLDQALTAVPAQAWSACAELNVLLQLYSQMLRDVPLHSYHSFTRGPKAQVFQHAVDADRQFPADSGAPPAKQPLGAASPSHGKPWASPPAPHSGARGPHAAWQGPECWRPVWRPQELAMHLQMASTVLQTAFGRYADASICKYSFVPPPCLAEWCQKWGLAREPGSTLTLMAINAHVSDAEVLHVAGGEACPSPGSGVHTLFVPVIRQ